VSGEIQVREKSQPEAEPQRGGHAIEVHSTEDVTQPGSHTPAPGSLKVGAATTGQVHADPTHHEEGRGAILGVGMSSIGHGPVSQVSGEIVPKVAPGTRVLVPGPNGLMQSATVRQLLQGYYELEVGHSGETIWVPIGGVVPEH
jgi:hypothetical protein